MWKFSEYEGLNGQHSFLFRLCYGHIAYPCGHIYSSVRFCFVCLVPGISTTFQQTYGSGLTLSLWIKPSIIEAKCVILYDMNTLSRALLIFIGIIGTSCAPLITICCEPHDTLIIVDDLIRGEGIVKYQPQRGQKIIKVQCTRDTLNFHEYYIQVSKKITFHNIYLTNL